MTTDKVSWTIYVKDKNLKKQIKKMAIDHNLPVGDMVTLIIEEWLESKKIKKE